MSAIAESLSRVVVGNPIQFLNLSLFPLLAEGLAKPGYRLLDDALGDGGARVTEVSEVGHVPELCFVNRGDLPVLLVDGEELIGAKQNRILNLSILAPAHQTIVIPVSCVEAGRWHAQSAEFGSARRAHFGAGRARKAADVSDSLRRRGSRESNQSAVWHDIAERSRRMKVSSPTGAAAALATAKVERFAAIGEGEDWRLIDAGLAGGALVKDGRLIHLCAFRTPADTDGGAAPDPAGRNRLVLSLDTDRRLIRWRGDSERYLHLRLRTPRLGGERAPVDLALALDRSGSMGGDKWPRACEAALTAIERLGPRDRVALVVFDDHIDTLLPLTAAGTEARRAAADALGGVGPRGSTNLGEGWLTACGLIGREATNERLRRCFVLTDGQANVGIVDPAELAQHAGQLLQLGIRTSTFGVGNDYNEELLGALADAGGGAVRDIANAAGIPSAIAQELGDALEVVYADSRVQLAWQADLAVAVMGPWPVTPSDHALIIRTGDLVSEQVLDLLVSLRFPAGNKNADCTVRVTVSDGDRPLGTEEIHWTWVDWATRKGQPRQAAVERRVGEQLAHQARREAAARNRDGDLEGACDSLRTAAQRIRNYGSENPALLALADSIKSEIPRYQQPLPARDVKAQIAESRAGTLGRGGAGARIRDLAPQLAYLPCQDSPELAERCRKLVKIPREQAAALGQSALAAITAGAYPDAAGQPVDWSAAVAAAVAAKRSLPPDAVLPTPAVARSTQNRVQVANETTLTAARRLANAGERVLALNFANGIQPGGGFLNGARAQEEVLCRSSALYATLRGDPMYAAHAARTRPDSTDWAILSPEVPVFRTDDGTALPTPWMLSVLTCAAPYAPGIGQPLAGDLLAVRIRRVLAIARAYDYSVLVLGAWGCGAFGNDPARTASDFHAALAGEFNGAFAQVVFAIADWSAERRNLAPFRDLFAAGVA
ncbi:TIGR02452 family protein [Candidatus Thiodictyon syntrophicum]|jgi:uncharacterized protein (TIGR02452 family)|uniref:TIGR02452 family protein n=1 Tax=Candidatus Thiodictyon syntrophicum TaxID=1166950 RepID=A0A2K8U5I6_9GAMM|nr:TIGR02452 family protein [Candidatus Thiodictyon syntrophicum]AUB80858.1 TIGR02452 family protein [Candidatus Thiodictyon syntrophicum]